MRRGRRWLALLLALVLAVGLLPTAALAEEGSCTSNIDCSASTHEDTYPKNTTEITRAQLAEKLYNKFYPDQPATDQGFTDIGNGQSGTTSPCTPTQWTAINVLAEKGILSGTSGTTFSPFEKVTRAELAVVFWRVTGCKSHPTAATPPYSDVTGAEPYGPAVLALTAMGIIQGEATGEFNATQPASVEMVNLLFAKYDESTVDTGSWETGVTRLDMLMQVYAQYKGDPVLKEKAEVGVSKDFADIGACTPEQQAAIKFFTKAGVISGLNTNPPMFQPYGAASNFQIALLLQRCAEMSTPDTGAEEGGDPAVQGVALLSDAAPLAEEGGEEQRPNLEEMVKAAFEFLGQQGADVTAATENPHAPGLESSLTAWTASVVPATPTIRPADQTFTGTLEVTISAGDSAETDGTVLYYTLDGSDPTTSSTQYTKAITITDTITVKAIAVKNNLVSPVAAATYTVPALAITPSRTSLTGGGTVTFTISNAPENAEVTVACDNPDYAPTLNSENIWSVTLPNTTANYTFTVTAGDKTATCTVMVSRYVPSNTGSTTTNTERNPDGSTTTTTTNKATGTVTETTRYPDGSQEVVETKKDGTVITTTTDTDGNETAVVENPNGSREVRVEQADGTSASAVADQAGRIQAEVSLSSRAVSAAQEDGEAVMLPIPNIPISGSSEDASLVEIALPRSTGAVKVEIPVADAGPGTVAVIVNDDGTETVAKKSVALDGGLTLTLETGATVKIADNSKDFDDTYGHWAEDAIAFATAHEMFGGTSADTFSPDTPMTRGMLAVVLHRFEDTPNHTFTGSFGDVAPGSWYADGIHWMADNGIIGGYGNGNFGADDSITREQLATILYRYAGVMGYGTSGSASLDRFSDVDSVSGYAVEAMGWAVGNGLIGGMGDGTLAPQGSATRAQVATILMRFVENLVN